MRLSSRRLPQSNGGGTRRKKIERLLQTRKVPVQGNQIARLFRVSRQCVVQDLAILRASGAQIEATPRGYRVMPRPKPAVRAVLACRHKPDRTQEELQILVDYGCKVLDVIVEHPLYGELRGSLMLESRADVADFCRNWRGTHAQLLSSLTHGVHLHTVEAARRDRITRAKARLRARGFLLR
jgi:hypothetical protein